MLIFILILWLFIGILVGGYYADNMQENGHEKYNKYQIAFIIFCCGPFVWAFLILVGLCCLVAIGFKRILDFLGTLPSKEIK